MVTIEKDDLSVRVKVNGDKMYYCLYDITKNLGIGSKGGNSIKEAIERAFKRKLSKSKIGKDDFSFIDDEQLEYFLRCYSTSAELNAFLREIPYRYKSYMAKQEIAKESQKPKVEVEVPSVVEKEIVSTNVDVKLFNFEMFDVETLFENNTPYFKLTDIEKVLGLTKGQSAKWIKDGWFDEDEVKLRISQLGGHPIKYIAESGLYRILNRTNSPKARPFERWITKEVLPSLRKNGGYIANQENMTPEQILANAMVVAQNIINSQKQTIAYQGEKLNDYKAVEKTRRSKMELAKAINKNVKLLAEQKFNKQYANAYNYIYSIFSSHHNISVPIDMNYLKKNNDYLEEVLRIVLAELD